MKFLLELLVAQVGRDTLNGLASVLQKRTKARSLLHDEGLDTGVGSLPGVRCNRLKALSYEGQNGLGDVLSSNFTIKKEFSAPTECETGTLWVNVLIEEGCPNEPAVHNGVAVHAERSVKMSDVTSEV